ncbi:hypothetical protein APSETT445_008508 [Aspergillus pseudonomiae]
MAPICCIIPEHVHQKIIETGQAPQHVINACQSTIDKTRELQTIRIQHGQSLLSVHGQQQPSEGIIPPYILETIARHAVTEEQRDSSIYRLAHDTEHRVVAGTVRHLFRTVYNAHHSSDDLPRDDIMIKEGGPLLTKERDPSLDANECYIGFKKTYDFYFELFKRDSVNDQGLKLDGFVHFAHWKDFKKLPIKNDHGGVHINSGIPNHAFYQACKMIGGYAWETAGPVWYKALTSGKLSEDATFKEFADLTIQNAGEYEKEIKEAWSLVGYPFVENGDEL